MLTNEEQKLLLKIFGFADKHRVAFFPVQDIIKKVRTMAANENRCICMPKERTCPCDEAVREIFERGKCTCMLFCTYEYGNDYLHKHFYIYGGKLLDDKERKKKSKEAESEKHDRCIRAARIRN